MCLAIKCTSTFPSTPSCFFNPVLFFLVRFPNWVYNWFIRAQSIVVGLLYLYATPPIGCGSEQVFTVIVTNHISMVVWINERENKVVPHLNEETSRARFSIVLGTLAVMLIVNTC